MNAENQISGYTKQSASVGGNLHCGVRQLIRAFRRFIRGMRQPSNAAGQLPIGSSNLPDNSGKISKAIGNLPDRIGQITKALRQFAQSRRQLPDGISNTFSVTAKLQFTTNN